MRASASTFLFLIFPVLAEAGNVAFSTAKLQGESSYIVENPDQGLKSKLIFPFDIYVGSFGVQASIDGLHVQMKASFPLDKTVTSGKDYDWKNDSLTVYSDSRNLLDHFSQYEFMLSKEINPQLNFFSKFTYRKLDFNWRDTVQVDYVKNQTSTVNGLSLKFEQDFYQLNLGMSYQSNFSEDLIFKFKPSFISAYVQNKDSHLLRNFYTRQFAQTLGYNLDVSLVKVLGRQSELSVRFAYQTFEGQSADMDYFNVNDYLYASYPSKYFFEERSLGVGYVYHF